MSLMNSLPCVALCLNPWSYS